MLRRKLLLILGPLVVLLAVMAVASIWLLQDVFQRLNHVNTQAWALVDNVHALSSALSEVEVELYNLQIGRGRHLDALIDAVDRMRTMSAAIATHVTVRGDCRASFSRLQGLIPTFERHIGALATAQDPKLAMWHNQESLSTAVEMRREILDISQCVRTHALSEQQSLTSWFRWLVLGLAIVFLLVINIAAMVLLRMATMILRPVDQLVSASRQLAMERFDYRVDLGGNDEFDELAAAFNNLGSQLQANEQKKVEVLSQVALTLNHELNNAIAIIELQLNLLSRQTGGNAAHERRLREIHQSLARMTDTVQSLKNVRRIVLTDYVSGQKMLDLRRSVQSDESASQDAAPITTQPASQTPAPLAASAATLTRPAGQAVNAVPGSNGP